MHGAVGLTFNVCVFCGKGSFGGLFASHSVKGLKGRLSSVVNLVCCAGTLLRTYSLVIASVFHVLQI